jgi:hypothetical protein
MMSAINGLTPLPPISSTADPVINESSEPAGKAYNEVSESALQTSPAVTASTEVIEAAPQTSLTVTSMATVKVDLSQTSLDDLFKELEVRTARLKTLTDFSNVSCSADMQYLQAASRYGSTVKVRVVSLIEFLS